MGAAVVLALLIAQTPQIAIVAENSDEIRAEIESLEASVRAMRPDADFALVHCSPNGENVVGVDFGKQLREIATRVNAISTSPHSCTPSVDTLAMAVDDLSWQPSASKAIVVLGSANGFLRSGRGTIEEVVNRGSRLGIVLHAVEVARFHFFFSSRPMERLVVDVERFIERPTWPLGRPPSHARHATLLSGGTYEFLMCGKLPERDVRGRIFDDHKHRSRDALKAAYGHKARGSQIDVLDLLADGTLRPYQVQRDQLPEVLREAELEPLLDAIFDFVDARRALESALEQTDRMRAGSMPSRGEKGAAIAEAIFAPRRIMPSRR